jgi:hypothetical protein
MKNKKRQRAPVEPPKPPKPPEYCRKIVVLIGLACVASIISTISFIVKTPVSVWAGIGFILCSLILFLIAAVTPCDRQIN